MVDLFRYIEHDFAVPAATDAIDVTNQSEFQTALSNADGGGQEVEGQQQGATERYSTDLLMPGGVGRTS